MPLLLFFFFSFWLDSSSSLIKILWKPPASRASGQKFHRSTGHWRCESVGSYRSPINAHIYCLLCACVCAAWKVHHHTRLVKLSPSLSLPRVFERCAIRQRWEAKRWLNFWNNNNGSAAAAPLLSSVLHSPVFNFCLINRNKWEKLVCVYMCETLVHKA